LDAAEADVVLADFEGSDYRGWTTNGSAFGTAPAQGTLPNQMKVTGFIGKGLANSFLRGDASTGTLTSPEFIIHRRFLTFLIGGGGYPGKTCVNLLVDGAKVRTATGPNTEPGGSEELALQSWEVADLAGKKARLEIVDQATGGWGHINVDQIVLTDLKPPALRANARREIICDRLYLNLPVKIGAKKRRMSIQVDQKVAREFEIELADDQPSFWVFLDLTPFRGKKATVVVDQLPETSRALDLLEVSDTIKGAENLYRETLRPQFHFSSRRGWLNDPNGLVFSAGEYHLYYQHNPYGWDWGNMHWGHAVSPDLVHWRELPIAIYPRKFGDWAFSGSAVVDRLNTSGWKRGDEELLVGAYTSTGRGECIIYSNDRGLTWTEFEGNPVVKHQGRDPRLLWHEPTRRWVMALYNENEGKRWITFHTSPDLKQWTFASRIEGFFECPDLFELSVDGDRAKTKWVLTAASSEYMIGTFDGREFRPETPKLPGHRGEAFYAAQTFSNEPHGRCVQIGWGQMKTPGMPFNQMMSFPCELSLRTFPEGIRLCWQPVREIEKLRARTTRIEPQPLPPGANPLAQIVGELFDVRAELGVGRAAELGLGVGGTEIVYDVKKSELMVRGKRAPLRAVEGKVRLRMLRDRTSLEIFGNDGELFMPIALPNDGQRPKLSLFARGGEGEIQSLEVHELRSTWRK
jgi:fructan beta-fructosidase